MSSNAFLQAIGRPADVLRELEPFEEVAGQPGTVTREYPISLPACEPERDAEAIVDHGARVLTFILQTSCTATLSDRELQHADLAAHYAIIARGILPAAADRISDARHLIAAMLRDRAQLTPDGAAVVEGGQLVGKLGTGGPGDREPLQPNPKINPPAGEAIDLTTADPPFPLAAGRPWSKGGDRVRF